MNKKTRSIIKVISISTLVLAACATALQAAPQEESSPLETEIQNTPQTDPLEEGTPVQEKVETSEVSTTVETEPVESTEPGQSEPPSGEALLDPDEKPPSGTQNEFSTDFSVHTVPYSEILSGGPPKNGIPAVDDPQFISIEEADEWLEPLEPLIFFKVGDDARAYPIQILMYHEIVNDIVGDVPVVVTFCPLCNTGIAFERTVDGEVLDFGTTGRLRFSNLIMYDRQTETWWQQASGEAIAGDLTGTQLAFLPASIISWEEFKSSFPDGTVLSRETGFNRSYGRNPYTGYDNINNSPFLYRGPSTPGELPAVARVLTVDMGAEAVAYPYLTLEEIHVANDTVAGQDIVVFWQTGTASALDVGTVAGGRDVGTANAFSREVDGQTLTFSYDGSNILDDQTGSEWSVLGQALSGELEGTQLEPVVAVNHFWFSWAAFKPETRIYQP